MRVIHNVTPPPPTARSRRRVKPDAGGEGDEDDDEDAFAPAIPTINTTRPSTPVPSALSAAESDDDVQGAPPLDEAAYRREYLITKAKHRYLLGENESLLHQLERLKDVEGRIAIEQEALFDKVLRVEFGDRAEQLITPVVIPGKEVVPTPATTTA